MRQWLLGAIVILLFAGPLRATFIDLGSTIGSNMAGADSVVRGVVASCEQVVQSDPAIKHPDSFWKITVKVHETFRGTPVQEVVVYDSREPEWAGLRGEQVLFLETGGGHHRSDPFWSAAPWIERGSIDLTVDAPQLRQTPLITDDLRRLHTKDELLNEMRRVGTTLPMTAEVIIIRSPGKLKSELGLREYTMIAVYEKSLATARRWLKSDDPELKWCGAEILKQSKSASDLHALSEFAQNMPRGAPYYGTGARAGILRYLHGAGVGHLPSIVDSTAEPFASQWWNVFSTIGILALPTIYVAMRHRRARTVLILWWLTLGIIVTFAARSYWPQDAVTWGNYDLAMERGTLYLFHHELSGELPSPLLYCRPNDLIRVLDVRAGGSSASDEEDYARSMAIPLYRDVHNYHELALSPLGFFTPMITIKPWYKRFSGPLWKTPIWLIFLVVFFPRVLLAAWYWWRQFRQKRYQGFPVQATIAER